MEPKQAEGWREIIADLRTQLREAQERAERATAKPCYCCVDSCSPGCRCHDTLARDDSGNTVPPAEALEQKGEER